MKGMGGFLGLQPQAVVVSSRRYHEKFPARGMALCGRAAGPLR